jgi:hypothetical protein
MSNGQTVVSIDLKVFMQGVKEFERNQVDMDWAIPRLISDAMTVGFNSIYALGAALGFSQQGLYLQSITMETSKQGRDTEGAISNAAKDPVTGYRYPEGLEVGTAPHIIRAKFAKALHFFMSDGTEIFAKRVRHPGTRPYWIYRDSAAAINKKIPALAENIIRRASQHG